MTGATRITKALAAIAGLIAVAALQARAQEGLREAVKAAYIYKLAPFVEWPVVFAGARPALAPPAPFDICVVGEDPFGALLDRTIADQFIRERPVRALRFASAPPDHGCEIMYIAGSEHHPVSEALERVRGEPVLTVTDSVYSRRERGIVHFVEREGRIGFVIDSALARENGLAISSKLLDLAVEVRGEPRTAADRSEG